MKYYTFLDGWLGQAFLTCECSAYVGERVSFPSNADVIIVAGWKYRLPLFGPLMLNLHPSPLPAYRGPQPLLRQQKAGERYIGLTVHEIDEGLDTGPIRVVRYIDMGSTSWTLDEAGAAIRKVLRPCLHAALWGGPGWPQEGSIMELPK